MENEEEETQQEREPQITSDNPEDRKLARTLRIQRRRDALRKQKEKAEAEANQVEVESVEEKNPIQVQLEQSSGVLDKLTIEAEEHLTNVKIANEARETDRREREGIGKEKLLAQLDEEAASAESMFNEIADKWSGILKYNDPLHISEDIQSQKEKCDELIKQKDEIIAEIREKIKKAEINFTIDQRKQVDDVNSLAKRIETQIITMRNAYRQELKLIEDVVMVERARLMEVSNKRWEELSKKRDQEETANSEKKTEEYWNFVRDMEVLDRDFKEIYRATNIKLENECDLLEREFERVKTEAAINTEKLDYNYQILKKREDENMIIRSQQKRRINKLQDVVNGLRRKIRDYYQSISSQAQKLTQDVKKLQKNILDIEAKADIMAKANDSKFNQIWNMNKLTANELVEKILQVDKVIHEQQLGLIWHCPIDMLAKKDELPSFKQANKTLSEIKDKGGNSKHTVLATTQPETNELTDEEIQNYSRILRNVLGLISDKTGFLVEDQLNAILEPYLESEKTLVRVDNVFSALCLREKGDIDIMLKYFLPYMFCPVCTQEKSMAGESLLRVHDMSRISLMDVASAASRLGVDDNIIDILGILGDEQDIQGTVVEFGSLAITLFDESLEGEAKGPGVMLDKKDIASEDDSSASEIKKVICQYQHPLMINPVYVLKALRDFLSKYHTAKASMPTMAARLSHKRSTLTRLVTTEDIETFWMKYKDVFPGDREKLWDILLEGLKRYHELLKQRKGVCEEVVCLRRQNQELRRIFANYIRKNPLPYE